jgi:hypothetical protein
MAELVLWAFVFALVPLGLELSLRLVSELATWVGSIFSAASQDSDPFGPGYERMGVVIHARPVSRR